MTLRYSMRNKNQSDYDKKLSDSNLNELNDKYSSRMASLQLNESKHEFFLSILKTCPYFVISSLSISSVLVLTNEILKNNDVMIIIVLTLIALFILAIVSFYFVKNYSNRISINKKEIDELRKLIDLREQMIIDYFGGHQARFDWGDYEHPRFNSIRYLPNNLQPMDYNNWIGPLRVEDVEYSYPSLTEKIKKCIADQTEYFDTLREYYRRALIEVVEFFKSKDQSVRNSDINHLIEAMLIYRNMRDKQIVFDQFKFIIENQFGTDFIAYIDNILLEKIAANDELNDMALNVNNKKIVVRDELFSIVTMMNHHFGPEKAITIY